MSNEPKIRTAIEETYWRTQRVLDKYLGSEDGDGVGEGMAADVHLLGEQRDILAKLYDALRVERCELCAKDVCSRHQPADAVLAAVQLSTQLDLDAFDLLKQWPAASPLSEEKGAWS